MDISQLKQLTKNYYRQSQDWNITLNQYIRTIKSKIIENEHVNDGNLIKSKAFSELFNEYKLSLFLTIMMEEKTSIEEFSTIIHRIYHQSDNVMLLSHFFNLDIDTETYGYILPRLSNAKEEEKAQLLDMIKGMASLFHEGNPPLLKTDMLPYLQVIIELIPHKELFFHSKLILFTSQFTKDKQGIEQILPLLSFVEKNELFKESKDQYSLNYWEGLVNNLNDEAQFLNKKEVKDIYQLLKEYPDFNEALFSLLKGDNLKDKNDTISFCAKADINFFPILENNLLKELHHNMRNINIQDKFYYSQLASYIYTTKSVISGIKEQGEYFIDYSDWIFTTSLIDNIPKLFICENKLLNNQDLPLNKEQQSQLKELITIYKNTPKEYEISKGALDIDLIDSYLNYVDLQNQLEVNEPQERKLKL